MTARRRRELSSPVLFRASAELQGMLHARYRLGTGATIGLFPYSAIIVRRVRPTSTSTRTPPRFSQPPGEDNARNNSWVYSAPQALRGLSLQRMTPDRSGIVSDPGLLRPSLPCMGFFHHSPAVPAA
jgi:hypothetical protein